MGQLIEYEFDGELILVDEDEIDEDDTDDGSIDLTVPQTLFTHSNDKYPLFVAGFGAGKSTCMMVNALNDLSYPRADIALYAPTYDLLKLITIPYLEEMLTNSDIPYKINKSDYICYVEDHGKIIMRSLDTPSRIVGYQVFRSHIDEIDTIGQVKANDAWNKVVARNRQKVFKYDENDRRIPIGRKPNGRLKFATELNRVSAYTTPEGFGFAYDRWEKKKMPGYKLFRAPTTSNPNLPEDYVQSLRDTYPPELIDAYINGFFVNLTSGAVYPSFDRDLNNSNEEVIGNEELYVGMDFNVMRGASAIHVLRDGWPVCVDEIHNAYDTDEQIVILKQRYPNNPIKVYPDASGKNRTAANTTETDIFKLEDAGFEVEYNYSNPPIKERVFSLSAMICNANGVRRYKVNVINCPNVTATLEQQVWGANGLPDKKANLDHSGDAVGYYIHSEFPIIKPSSGTRVIRGNY